MGWADVDGMLKSISSAQLAEWEAFYKLEPFGPEADNWNFANVIAQIANMFSGKKGRRKKAQDFILKIRSPVQSKQSSEQIKNLLIAISRKDE